MGGLDGDGDLDLIVTGSPDFSTRLGEVYENVDGVLVRDDDASAVVRGVDGGSVAWGDYDNDGDLDLVVTGAIGNGGFGAVYENVGAGVLVEDAAASAVVPNVFSSSVAWGDVDGDGDLDLVVTGNPSIMGMTRGVVVRNDRIPPPAMTFVVTKTDDTNDGTCDTDCSLREAIAAADANPATEPDRIEFASGVQGGTIALSSSFGQLTLASDVVIDAEAGTATPLGVTLDAGQQGFRVMGVNGGVTAEIVGLTLTGGNPSDDGGGIVNIGGTLTVTNSTLSGNTASNLGGGVYLGSGSAEVRNSTFRGNTAAGSAFGGDGGGIFYAAVLTLGNTVFERGTDGANLSPVLSATTTSEGFNVCGDACGLTGTGDLVNTDPLVGPLADNGGPTLTHALLAGSPAIDIGGTCGPTDQRGFEAPIIGLATNATALCDAGSLETEILDAEAPTVVVSTTAPNPTAVEPIPVTFTFNEAVTGFEATDMTVTGGTLQGFDASAAPVYTAEVSPDDAGEVTIAVAAGVATDLAGNPNEASNTLSVTFDDEGPAGYTAAFDQSAVNTANETAVSFTITDAEVGATFAYTITSDGGAGSVTGSGTIGGAAPREGSPSALRMSGNKGGASADLPALLATTTSEQVTGLDVSTLPDGTLTLSVVLTDPLGNEGDPATDTVLKDTVVPTLVVSTTVPDPTNTEPIPVAFTFSEEVTGFEASDVTVTAVAPDARGTPTALRFADFAEWADRADVPYGEVVMTPQRFFLPLVLNAAAQHDGFTLVTGADVQGLVRDENAEDGAIRGVRYERDGVQHEVRAPLTVACDGRHSRVRTLAGLTVDRRPAPIDVLWFHLPKRPSDATHPGDAADPADAAGAYFRFGPGAMVALMDAGERWQVGMILAKDALPELKAQGLDAFRARVAATVPDVADRLGTLRSWDETALLSIETSRLKHWHRSGLLCIGDAAHAMSPVGMVGINLAIQDAEAAAALLGPKLRAGAVTDADLAAVQRMRQGPVRLAQTVQDLVHRWVMRPALRGPDAYRFPAPVRALLTWPPLRRRATHLIDEGRLG